MKSKLFHWPVRVYYEDTDAGGVVYHARYIAFYERARSEFLRSYEISQQQLLSSDIAFAVRRMSVEYFAPALLDDLLDVRTKVVSVRRASIMFAQSIYNSQNALLSSADVLIACVSPSIMKPIALPEFIVSEFSSD